MYGYGLFFGMILSGLANAGDVRPTAVENMFNEHRSSLADFVGSDSYGGVSVGEEHSTRTSYILKDISPTHNKSIGINIDYVSLNLDRLKNSLNYSILGASLSSSNPLLDGFNLADSVVVDVNTESSLLSLKYKKVVVREEMLSLMELGVLSFEAEAKSEDDLEALKNMKISVEAMKSGEYIPVSVSAYLDISYSGSSILRFESFQNNVVVSALSVAFDVGDISSLRDYLMKDNISTHNMLMAVAASMASSRFEVAMFLLNLDVQSSGADDSAMTVRESIAELAADTRDESGVVVADLLDDVVNSEGDVLSVKLVNKTNYTILQMIQSPSIDDFDLVVDGKSRPELLVRTYSYYKELSTELKK